MEFYCIFNMCVTMPDDYIPPVGFNVTFAADGLTGDATQCVMISTTDDDVLEGDHNFTVMVDSATPDVVTVGTPSSVTATLLDNDSMFSLHCCLKITCAMLVVLILLQRRKHNPFFRTSSCPHAPPHTYIDIFLFRCHSIPADYSKHHRGWYGDGVCRYNRCACWRFRM